MMSQLMPLEEMYVARSRLSKTLRAKINGPSRSRSGSLAGSKLSWAIAPSHPTHTTLLASNRSCSSECNISCIDRSPNGEVLFPVDGTAVHVWRGPAPCQHSGSRRPSQPDHVSDSYQGSPSRKGVE